jgi:hypothetical protein
LKAAMNCRFSNLTIVWQPRTCESVREWALGVRSIEPASRRAAASTSSKVTGNRAGAGADAGDAAGG